MIPHSWILKQPQMPHSSEILPSPLAGHTNALKRKAEEEPHDIKFDSDCIAVERCASKQLAGVARAKAQKKRIRVLKCVALPAKATVVNDWANNPQRESHTIPSFDNQTLHEKSRPRQSKNAKQLRLDAFRLPSTHTGPTNTNERLTDKGIRRPKEFVPPQEPASHNSRSTSEGRRSTSLRARRNAMNRSYARYYEPESSEDEPSRPTTKTNAQQHDSDFEEATDTSIESEEEDSGNESSSVQSCDSESQNGDVPVRGPQRTGNTDGKATRHLVASVPKRAVNVADGDIKRLLDRQKGEPKGLDLSLPPLFEVKDIFTDATKKALALGLDKSIKNLFGRRLRVATMCSGTESPLLALQMISEALRDLGEDTIEVEHIFSAEIVPYKQAYIERNFAPPVIFRDITEFISSFQDPTPMATTAYGALAAIPTEVDIVIAGTSCVDYSRLNSNKKGIADGGESGQTWLGALAYCRACKPPLILFENVFGADWPSMLAHYRELDYDCKVVLADTKDYYIPQTRQRGYMACFRTQHGSQGGAAKEWQSLMQKFRRLASSPVSSFLIPNDQVIIRQQAHDDDTVREVDWSQCEITQMQYRADEQLGNARPFTQWTESGTISVPDNGNQHWYRRQVERVLDTIDCAILRKAKEGYDARYKTRTWDLSQNIYRFRDHSPFGITGCITPDGIFFISDAGRAMAAEETLKLQGIPLSKISFTTETAKEVQDLAGNAMTSTVIGCSLLAALITGHHLVTDCRSTTIPTDRPPVRQLVFRDNAVLSSACLTKAKDVDVSALVELATRALQKCYCEGNFGMLQKPVQQCQDCGHTTHVSCGGNPRHRYEHDQYLTEVRLSPAAFEEHLRSLLPLHLAFKMQGNRSAFDTNDAPKYQMAVEHALVQNFTFASIRRTHCWTVEYVGSQARLDLVIDSSGAEWRLFAIPAKDLPSDDRLRQELQQPIARAILKNALLPQCSEWKLRRPVNLQLSGSVEPKDACSMVSTWRARNEMPEYLNHKQPAELVVHVSEDCKANLELPIDGTYRYLPNCGTACDSLYARVDIGTGIEPAVYLFLDPTRTGPENQDCFVFSRNKERLEYMEIRHIIARIDAHWRPWPMEDQRRRRAQLIVDSLWVSSSLSLQSEVESQQLHYPIQDPFFLEPCGDGCYNSELLMGCSFKSSRGANDWEGNKAEDLGFLSESAWLFEVIRREIKCDWRQISLPKISCLRCSSCAPPRPQLRWKIGKDGKAIVPFEDPVEAAIYERAIKGQPDTMIVKLSKGEPDSLRLDFGVNITSLAHRAIAKLPTGSSIGLVNWRLNTAPMLSTFAPFPGFQLHAAEGMKPYNADLHMSISLFPKQRQSLFWMKQQEEGIEFSVETSEEALLAEIGWRAEVCASAKLCIRGGICADHPGFGKTIISLALTQSEFLENQPVTIREKLESRRTGLAEGLYVSLATLIICPGTLLKQWSDEVRDKLRWRDGFLSINTLADLNKCTIAGIKSAKIIIVNRSLLGSEAYAERLAAFAGVPGPATKSWRAFAQWLQFAKGQVAEHLQVLDTAGITELKRHVKDKYKRFLHSDEFKAAIPSRRLRGKNYVAQNSKKAQSATTLAAFASLDVTGIEKPLFEMFYFNRIIIDEFHQYDQREYATIRSLQADKRWGLSATPALGDFYDISQMAGLIGVPLPIGSDARGVMKAANRRTLQREMTDFERFDTMARESPSYTVLSRIHALDQRFLDTFVRRNIMVFTEMPYTDCLQPISLDLAHHAVYAELSQQLNSLDMRIKKGKKANGTTRDQQLHEAVRSSETAEEALSKAASYYKHDDLADPESSLTVLIKTREHELRRLEHKLHRAMFDAHSKVPDDMVKWKKTCLDDGTLGDGRAIDIIRGIFGKRNDRSVMKKRTGGRAKDDSDSDKENQSKGQKGKNELVSVVNNISKRLVTASRSHRYLENLQCIQRKGRVDCDHPEHDTSATLQESGVSALCGHAICRSCHTQMQQHHNVQCPSPGCKSAMQNYHLVWKQKMGVLESAAPLVPYGMKIEKVMDLLEEIHKLGDQVILFVQYATQLDEVEKALQNHRISSTVVKDSNRAGSQIAEFRASKEKTVIVLNASDETAAGSNLQNANHVIFFAPLLRDSQYGYESTMAQAIGRVRRPGQTKQIHVYRFVALDTIDVDILEHRERRLDALVEVSAPEIHPPAPAPVLNMNEEPKAERTQLVREHGRFSLRPRSWLVRCGTDDDPTELAKVRGKDRVRGWEDFSSLIKFSRAYTEDDD